MRIIPESVILPIECVTALDNFALTDFMRRDILSTNKVYSRE